MAAKNGTANNYSFADRDVLPDDISYYRLKMVDQDGHSRYSQIIPVKNNRVKGLAVFLNPAKDGVTITLSFATINATLKITNGAGKTILSPANQSGSRFAVTISRWPAGGYCGQVTESGGTVVSTSFVKQ